MTTTLFYKVLSLVNEHFPLTQLENPNQLNKNNNNNLIGAKVRKHIAKRKANKKLPDAEETRVNSHNLVRKCLIEVASLYKMSALIEIIIFITISMIFFIFYLFEANIGEYWAKNERFKNEIFKYRDLLNITQNLTNLNNNNRALTIIESSLNYSLLKEMVF